MTTAPSGLARQARACSSASGPVVGDHDALAGGQPVVLDDVRGAEGVERLLDLGLGGAHVRQAGGHLGRRHDLLGEGLAALEPGRLGRRAEAGDAGRAHRVGHARHQRRLGADDDQVDPERGRQRDDARRRR